MQARWTFGTGWHAYAGERSVAATTRRIEWPLYPLLGYARHMPGHHASISPELPRRAKLFRNGRNQALRIPRDLEFPGNEVVLHKEDDRLIVEPVARRRTLAEILPGLPPLTDDFPEASDSPAQPEHIF